MKMIVVGAAFALGLATAAGAAPQGSGEKLDLPMEAKADDAKMLTVPDNDHMEREFPRIALQLGIAGRGVVTCEVKPDGQADNCRVVSEAPAGLGFGAAALSLVPYFTFQSAKLNGRPVDGEITLPIRFQLGTTPSPIPMEPIGPPTSAQALDLAKDVIALDDEAGRLNTIIAKFLRGFSAYLVASGASEGGAAVEDVWRQAAAEVVADELDRRARLMAATMTADQLRATLAYLRTPAGAALLRARAAIENPDRPDLGARINEKAKIRLCGSSACSEP